MNNDKNEDKNVAARWAFFGTVIAALITGVITLIVADKIPFFSTSTPAPIETSVASLPTPIIDKSAPAPIITSGTILFEEDFQDNKVQGIGFSADPQWKFAVDETGNKVYEIDNSNGSDYKGFSLGADEWKDYSVEYRARILDGNNQSEIGLQVRSSGYKYYVLILGKNDMYLAYDLGDGKGWVRLITQPYQIEPNVWYKIRVDVQGEQLKVYINDSLRINAKGSEIKSGWVMIIDGAVTHAQVDDIRVTALDSK